MKKNIIKIGNLVKFGLTCGLSLALVSCGGEEAGIAEEGAVAEDEIGVVADETAAFGGDVEALGEEAEAGLGEETLYTDFGATELYDNWDANNDDLLDENESSGAFFDTWDTNDDNRLEENEWNTAVSDFGLDNDERMAWNNWDANADAYVLPEEYVNGMRETDFISELDTNQDALLDEREFSDGVYGLWEQADVDGELDEEEYNDVYVRYFDAESVQYMPERG